MSKLRYPRTASTTLPAGTPTYTTGDLVANSATAGSVVPLSWPIDPGVGLKEADNELIIRKCKLRKSGTSTTNAQFRLHLFLGTQSTTFTCANGDDGAFSVNNAALYLGAMDVTIDRAFTDGAVGMGVPVVGDWIKTEAPRNGVIYGLIEARAGYTRAAAEVFTAELEDLY